MSRFLKWLSVLGLTAFILTLIFFISLFGLFSSFLDRGFPQPYQEKKPHLAILALDGPVLQPDKSLKAIESISKNAACKGILVRVNSPGGAVSASQELYKALQSLRSDEFPVVVSMGNTAASGGYYLALGASRIFANKGTVTGSIGVIAQFPEMQELFSKIGISMEVIKNGRFKDAGSPFRLSTKEDRECLQRVVDDVYEQFIDDILANRDISREKLLSLADGRIFTGQQAVSAGLVDTIGGLAQAKNYLVKVSGLDEDALFINAGREAHWLDVISSKTGIFKGLVSNRLRGLMKSGLYYLWPAGISEYAI
ncbi:signal peptide peptidase SppA [Fibrobacterota bacterium]